MREITIFFCCCFQTDLSKFYLYIPVADPRQTDPRQTEHNRRVMTKRKIKMRMCNIRKADFKYSRDPRVVNKKKKTKKKKKQKMPVNKKPPESPQSASPAFSDTDVQITTNKDVSQKPPSPPVTTEEDVNTHLDSTEVLDGAANDSAAPLPVGDAGDGRVVNHGDADTAVATDGAAPEHSAAAGSWLARNYENLGEIWDMLQKRGHTLSSNIRQQRGISIIKEVDRKDGGTDYILLFSL